MPVSLLKCRNIEVKMGLKGPLHGQYLLSIFRHWQHYWLCEDKNWMEWQVKNWWKRIDGSINIDKVRCVLIIFSQCYISHGGFSRFSRRCACMQHCVSWRHTGYANFMGCLLKIVFQQTQEKRCLWWIGHNFKRSKKFNSRGREKQNNPLREVFKKVNVQVSGLIVYSNQNVTLSKNYFFLQSIKFKAKRKSRNNRKIRFYTSSRK